jgi:hypothetical protein
MVYFDTSETWLDEPAQTSKRFVDAYLNPTKVPHLYQKEKIYLRILVESTGELYYGLTKEETKKAWDIAMAACWILWKKGSFKYVKLFRIFFERTKIEMFNVAYEIRRKQRLAIEYGISDYQSGSL